MPAEQLTRHTEVTMAQPEVAPPAARLPPPTVTWADGAAPASGRLEARIEVVQMASGVALVGFMWTHVVLVSSVLLGAPVMDRLAGFLEDTRLAFVGAPFIVFLFLLHAVLAARKIPFQVAERRAVLKVAGSLHHRDTFTWMAQVVTGMAVLVLGAIHLWVILSGFPIQAAKSAARVHGVYVWFYAPLLLAVEVHMSVGLYRAAIKWGWVPRAAMHRLTTLTTVFFLSLGAATLLSLWRLGAQG